MKKPAEPNKKNFDEDFYVDVFCKSEYKLWLDSIQDNDATERQKQIHRRSYAEIGIQTKHTWSSEEDERPDWLLATFSLIFPIHPALLADAPHKGEFIDLEGWERGRYHGIKGFTLKSTDSPEMKRTSYYQESGRRFPASFAQSVGADESKPSDTRAEKRTSSKDHGPRFRFYHRRIAEQPGKTSFDLTQQWSNNYRELFEPLAAYPLEGRLTLTGLEFLQYLDTKSDADPNEEPRKSYYLVLHFVAQDCSNDVLTQISEALNRPRNGLRLLNETSIHECVKNYRHKPWRNNDSKKDSHYKLLRYFVDFAIKTVNNSIAISPKSDFPFSAHLTDGGYISGKVSQKWHKVEEKLASPSRIVCAIPGKESITQFPRLFRNANIQCLADDSWAKQTAWAWQLATGSDIYAEAVPNISPEALKKNQVGDFLMWQVLADDSNLAFVRRPEPSQLTGTDFKFLMLASTTVADIVILNMRCEYALNGMQVALRNDDNEQSDISLSARLNHIEHVQRLALAFRRHLWFNAIGNRVED